MAKNKEPKAKSKDSLAWKFAKFAMKTALVGTVSAAFGIAVVGLFDYQAWHEIAELRAVVEDTAWIRTMLRDDFLLGASPVDFMVGIGGAVGALGDFLGYTAELPTAEAARETLSNVASAAERDF